MRNIIGFIKAYRLLFIKVLFFELFYISIGFKGNSFNSRNDKKKIDDIPCPYFFLQKIYRFIKEKNIKSLIDLGCGSGRPIFFFNKKYKINYTGIEYFEKTFSKCNHLFINDKNVKIFNDDFMNLDFLKFHNECYFISNPLKDTNEFNLLINKIINKYLNSKKIIYFILVNFSDEKLNIFNEFQMLESFKINKGGHDYIDGKPSYRTRGYSIYSNKKILQDGNNEKNINNPLHIQRS